MPASTVPTATMPASTVPTVMMKPTAVKIMMVKMTIVTVTATATAPDSDIHATVGWVRRAVIAGTIAIVVRRGVRVITIAAIVVTRGYGDTAGEQKRGAER